MTLTFDLLTPKVDRFMLFTYERIVKLVYSFSECPVHKFGNRRMNEQIEETMPLAAWLTWES